MVNVPSPAISIVGRHNSGKTTLIEQVIAELVARGHDVGSVKHHSHASFDIDHPGKDSYRHRAAGASETVIASPTMMARVKTLGEEAECSDIVRSMPGHDIIVVEGYRKSGLPTIEIMRSGNPADVSVAGAFIEGARAGASLGTDFTQASRGDAAFAADLEHKMPTSDTVAIVTDIPEARQAALLFNIPAFALDDIAGIADFLEEHYVRPRVTVVIQAGGESRRMGRSKATVPFAGRPLICRLVERLAPAADELLITTNEADSLAFLAEEYPELDIKLVGDAFDFRGALPGLYTALQSARNPYVAVVACDMVFASASLVVAESLMMAETGADVVVPVNKHGFEPFHALYRKSGCVPAVRRALDAGEKRAQAFFDDPAVRVAEFSQERVLAAEPRGGCFINANTPDELKRLEDSYLGE
ncbi:molybdopterin-guanine dinucleotide biosynthesis protein B [Adlercreutzia sp. ZJ242]|uniref:molybdopterin-guanine dinucleotide biosynthesis protein B n=1 Tax=Adlercreutzia sp. ZJ242 TaxID=2709409 RepID=UPI0013EB877A|nr:molybdopterin-guanine dinucleotide biosynthesis protein B [Adlercreutzia sp. ZJ242]